MENQQQESIQTVTAEQSVQKPNKKRAIKIAAIALGLIILAGAVYWFYSNQKKTPITTGAVIVPPSAETIKAYDQLYALLDKGNISGDGFTIVSTPLERKITIYVNTPYTDNAAKARDWLKKNGFGDIPNDKITFQQASQ